MCKEQVRKEKDVKRHEHLGQLLMTTWSTSVKIFTLFSREEGLRGCLITAYRSSREEWRDWFLLSGDSDRENGVELHQGRVRLVSGKRFFIREWSDPGTGSPGQWVWPQAARVQQAFGQCSCTWILGVLCGAGNWTRWSLWDLSNSEYPALYDSMLRNGFHLTEM